MSENRIFPARNLGVGEQWGREVEDCVHALSRGQSQVSQRLRNQERSAASSASSLAELQGKAARAASGIQASIDGTGAAKGRVDALEADIQRLTLGMPIVVNTSMVREGFAIPAGESFTPGVEVKVPVGMSNVSVFASLISRVKSDTTVSVRSFLRVNGDNFLGGSRAISTPGLREGHAVTTKNFFMYEGATLKIEFASQVDAEVAVDHENYYYLAAQIIFSN